jgi:hypothetical protein
MRDKASALEWLKAELDVPVEEVMRAHGGPDDADALDGFDADVVDGAEVVFKQAAADQFVVLRGAIDAAPSSILPHIWGDAPWRSGSRAVAVLDRGDGWQVAQTAFSLAVPPTRFSVVEAMAFRAHDASIRFAAVSCDHPWARDEGEEVRETRRLVVDLAPTRGGRATVVTLAAEAELVPSLPNVANTRLLRSLLLSTFRNLRAASTVVVATTTSPGEETLLKIEEVLALNGWEELVARADLTVEKLVRAAPQTVTFRSVGAVSLPPPSLRGAVDPILRFSPFFARQTRVAEVAVDSTIERLEVSLLVRPTPPPPRSAQGLEGSLPITASPRDFALLMTRRQLVGGGGS